MNGAPATLRAAAKTAARVAAAFLRTQEGTQAPARWSAKGANDWVTEVDVEAERLISASLRSAFPDAEIVGEELSPDLSPPRSASQAPRTVFIVDPLDGTTNFLHGYPYYAVSIGAIRDGRLAAGVVHHVVPDLVYEATAGGGAWLGSRRLGVSTVRDPAHTLIGTGFPFKAAHLLPRYLRQFAVLTPLTSGIRRAGSAALDLCDVAAGRYDGFWELILAPWDIAAGTLIVREAGGLVTGLTGEADVLRHGPIVAGNAIIHRWLLERLAAVDEPRS